jgi:D-alanyl-D-alanine carboxypeptidase
VPLPFPTAALAEVADGEVDAAVRAEVAAEHVEFLERAHNRGADSLTVIRAEEGTWTHVVGTVDGETPMTPEHQVGIGALGRVVLFAEVMTLVEDGALDLEREISHYLPKDLGFETDATVRDLLHHTSGLPDYHPAIAATIFGDPGHRFEPAELLAAVPERRYAVGTGGSATDDVLLGLAIEHVTGTNVAQAFRAHVLDAPGLEGLVVQPEERPAGPVALPALDRRAAERFSEGGGYLPSLAAASADWPAGGMASTTESLARFMQLLCGGHILSTTSLSELAVWAEDFTGDAGQPTLGIYSFDGSYAGMAMCVPVSGRVLAVVMTAPSLEATITAGQLVIPALRQ